MTSSITQNELLYQIEENLRFCNFGAKNTLKCFIAFLCMMALQFFSILSLIDDQWKLPPVLLPENKLNIMVISHFDYFSKFYTTMQFYDWLYDILTTQNIRYHMFLFCLHTYFVFFSFKLQLYIFLYNCNTAIYGFYKKLFLNFLHKKHVTYMYITCFDFTFIRPLQCNKSSNSCLQTLSPPTISDSLKSN